MNQLGKFNGVLLVSDFDDTLYGEDMRITRENVEALTYFTREGGTFTVATGRARPNFAPHASHIPINAPVILSNGSALYDFRTGEMIYETFLPDRVREDLQQMAREGRLTELDGPVTRFDAVTRPHTHFRCRACGAVLDLETVPYDERLDRLAAARGCVVTGHTLIFTGHCPRCAGQDGRHEYRPEEKRGNCKI